LVTIKLLCDIEKLKGESRLPETLVQFLEKEFRGRGWSVAGRTKL